MLTLLGNDSLFCSVGKGFSDGRTSAEHADDAPGSMQPMIQITMCETSIDYRDRTQNSSVDMRIVLIISPSWQLRLHVGLYVYDIDSMHFMSDSDRLEPGLGLRIGSRGQQSSST